MEGLVNFKGVAGIDLASDCSSCKSILPVTQTQLHDFSKQAQLIKTLMIILLTRVAPFVPLLAPTVGRSVEADDWLRLGFSKH